MSESDLRDANLRADKLQAQRDKAVALLREGATGFPHTKAERRAHIEWVDKARAFLETLP